MKDETLLPTSEVQTIHLQDHGDDEDCESSDTLSFSDIKNQELDIDIIKAKARCHKELLVFDRFLCCNLPEFEELYGGENGEASDHLDQEISRLSDTINLASSQAYTWRDSIERSQSLDLKDITASMIRQAADHLKSNLAILEAKNNILLVEHLRFCSKDEEVKPVYESAVSQLRHNRGVLISRFVNSNTFIVPQRPETFESNDTVAAVYDELLNYITACFYRLIYSSGKGKNWLHKSLAILARISRKLKDLKSTAQQAADECINCIEDLQEDLKYEGQPSQKRFVFNINDHRVVDLLDEVGYISDYFVNEFKYRDCFNVILNILIESLVVNISDESGLPLAKNCESSTFIEAVPDEWTQVVSSNYHGNISAAMGPKMETELTISYVAFCLLLPLAQQISNQKTKPADRNASAVLRWWWEGDDNRLSSSGSEKDGRAYVETLEECISVLVHSALTTSTIGIFLSQLILFMNKRLDCDDEVRVASAPKNARLAFSFPLQSQSGRADMGRRRNIRNHSSNANSMIMTVPVYSMEQGHARSAPKETILPGLDMRKAYQESKSRMQKWVIDSDAIIIKCRWVVAGILIPTLGIAMAGVALLVSPYQKPKNVDPANFLIFLWSIALSFLLVAKAFFVPDWPWHDFLRAEVCCRSVSEVSRITGLDKQLVILHLLKNESYLPLNLRGPYATALFSKKDEEEHGTPQTAFSMDEPISLDTVYASGFLVLKLTTGSGPRLLLIDGRLTPVFISEKFMDYDFIMANPPEDHKTKSKFQQQQQLQRQVQLKREKPPLLRTLQGLYVNTDITFV